jgi:hypothetical protein
MDPGWGRVVRVGGIERRKKLRSSRAILVPASRSLLFSSTSPELPPRQEVIERVAAAALGRRLPKWFEIEQSAVAKQA